MNKQRYNRIIDDAYKNFKNNFPMKKSSPPKDYINSKGQLLTKEEFIDKCKTDNEFSEMWGLMIEERELSSDERYNLLSESEKKNFIIAMRPMMSPDDKYDEVHYTIDNYYEHIPKRAIAITYNDKTIESYE